MSKKWMTSLMVSAMVVSSAVPLSAFAEAGNSTKVTSMEKQLKQPENGEVDASDAKITMDEAIKLARKEVVIPSDYKQAGIWYDKGWGNNGPVWRISWQKEGKDYSSIEVTIDAKLGSLLSIHHWNNVDEERTFPPKVDYNEAIEIAKKYMEQLYPDTTRKLVVDQDYAERISKLPYRERGFHEVRFVEKVNDIPFYESTVHINITGNGKVQNFSLNRSSNITFSSLQNVIIQSKAEQIFSNSIEMELVYLMDYSNPSKQNQVKLVYLPKQDSNNYYYYGGMSFPMIDAKTGKIIDFQGKTKEEQQLLNIPNKPVAEKAGSFPVLPKALTQNEALDMIKKNIDIPKGFEVQNAMYNESWGQDGLSVWSFSWRDKNNERYGYMSADINAKTGELIRYSNDKMYRDMEEGNKDEPVKISKEKALSLATQFVKKTAIDKVDKLYATQPNDQYYGQSKQPRYYHIQFVRKENGVPVQNQGVNITISATTGEISQYFSEWRTLELPNANQAITPDKAKATFLKDIKINISYFVPRSPDQNNNSSHTAIPVYQPISNPVNKYLDALDGKWRHAETGKVITDFTEAKDIKGHKYEKQLQTMIEYNIFDISEDGKINPDSNVTRGEFVEMLLRALGDYGRWFNEKAEAPFNDVSKDAAYYPYLQRAVESGLIKKDQTTFNPEEAVTREFVAQMLVRALGYDKLASMENVFAINYKDASLIKYKGHVGLLSKLEIMSGNEAGQFEPNGTMSKGNMADVLFRYLEKKALLSEGRPYFYH
jgi:Zn-dependent metalloprotease